MPPRRGPDGKFLTREELAELETATNTNQESNMATEIEAPQFVDDLPPTKRGSRAGGVWKDRLEPLLERQGQWARVYGPTNNPHALINNLRQGSASGIDADQFSFAGRVEGKDTVTETETDEETGEEYEVEKEVNLGYVYARFDTDEQRVEREEKRAKRAAARAEGNGQTDEDDSE